MHSVDIVLLDIHMPRRNGIDVARVLRENGYQGAIIFITRSDEHWRDAFEVKAFNHITKDSQMEDRFIQVFWNALLEVDKRLGKTLLFSLLGETCNIDIDSISHFEVEQHLVRVYYDHNKTFEFISSLTKIESLLFGNDDFMRVHRSALISVAHVEKIDEISKKIIMQNEAEVIVSQKYLKILKAKIAGNKA